MTDLRRAGPDDAEELAELFWRVRHDNAATIPLPVHPRETVLPFVQGLLGDDEVWVATDDGTPVALLAVGHDELDHLYVDAAHTNRGVGSRLVALAQERRPEGLALWVFASNVPAVRFYERHGFAVVGGTDGDNDEGAPDLRMEWRPVRAARDRSVTPGRG